VKIRPSSISGVVDLTDEAVLIDEPRRVLGPEMAEVWERMRTATRKLLGVGRPPPLPDKTFDGHFVMTNGRMRPPGTPLCELIPMEPNNGTASTGVVFFTSGVNAPLEKHIRSMRLLANTGVSVIGVHNATEGLSVDLYQSSQDKISMGDNPAVTTYAKLFEEKLLNNEPVTAIGHSQGALIIGRALRMVSDKLFSLGYTDEQRLRALGLVTVETYGGAATSYIDGPKYTHYINRYDVIPNLFGLSPSLQPNDCTLGCGAKIKVFDATQDVKDSPQWKRAYLFLRLVVKAHSIQNIYIPRRDKR
jgi:hypothetical protein